MKNKALKITLIIILVIVSILITYFMVSVINGKINLKNIKLFKSVSTKLVLDETYNIDLSTLDIKTSSADIYIKESPNNEVRVVIYGEEDKTTVSTTNNELFINIKDNFCIGFCFNNTSLVEVYLPNTYDKLIKIDNAYGDIEIGKFKNSTIEIEEDSGDILVSMANTVKINNEYGDIEIGEVVNADVHDNAGDINILSVYNAIVKNEYGEIKISNIYDSLDINNDCGDIILDNININKDSVIKNSYGDVFIGKTNEIYIEAETDLGDVLIKNNYNKSDINLSIKNDCGDIEVDN